jgi:DNA-binding transcriptional LysR family regulator
MAIDVLTGMRVFTAVVDAMSFAKAAEKLDLSRGMTSRYVAQVEGHLGVRLLNRTTRHLSLTEAGNNYYHQAVQVLAMVEQAEQSAAVDAAEPRGTLRLTSSMAFGATHLCQAINAYIRRYPDVKVDITLNDRTVDLIEEGFDVAIRIATRIDPGLVARPITTARIVACASPAYLKKHGTPQSPADLAQHNCLTYAVSSRPYEWRFQRKGRENVVKVNGTLHANNGNILCAAAVDGLGVILQPTFLVYDLIRTRKLVRILDSWEADVFTVYAVYPNRQFLPPKVRTLIDFLVARFGPAAYWDEGIK